MTDTMHHPAKTGDICITVRGNRGGARYKLRRAAIVSSEGWIESTRDVAGRDERLRAPDETIYTVAIRRDMVPAAEVIIRNCGSRSELQEALRPLLDDAFDRDNVMIEGR